MNDEVKVIEKSGAASKKEYVCPELAEYGSISKFTRGGTNKGSDGQSECNPPGNPTANKDTMT